MPRKNVLEPVDSDHETQPLAVLDGVTYEKQDFWISEQVQQGVNAGAVDELVLANNELMLKVFADTVAEWSAKLRVLARLRLTQQYVNRARSAIVGWC